MTTIAVMGGDGTGPVVVAESVKVLNAVGQKFGLAFRFDAFDCGAGRYLKTGKLLEDSEIVGFPVSAVANQTAPATKAIKDNTSQKTNLKFIVCF